MGAANGAQFGQHRGPRQIFNTHYLCSEQVCAKLEGSEGQWAQFQPWINDRGEALLRSSRLSVRFRETEEGWKIAYYRTENLFIADMLSNWTSSLIERSVLTAG